MQLKQVILIRKDLKMRRGKEIAQGSHASMAFLTSRLEDLEDSTNNQYSMTLSREEKKWLDQGMAKICLQVHSEKELLELHAKAKTKGLNSNLIQDSGRTEFNGEPTYTALAIGPNIIAEIDEITATLKLY